MGVDLTGKTDADDDCHAILGIIDHGSRRAISLTALKDKSSIYLLRSLLDAVEHFGVPRFVRTDNEAVFTSRCSCWVYDCSAFAISDQTSAVLG